MNVDKLFRLYEQHGSEDYIGEPVNQTEHMIQAAMFAENDGCEVDVILACFFHDIGHLLAFDDDLEQMDGFGVMHHEKLGMQLLVECGVPGRNSCSPFEHWFTAITFLPIRADPRARW